MALHMRLGFLARSAQRWIQGGTKIGQWGVPALEDFFFRLECNSNKLNASSYPELKYPDCLLFGLISQIWQSCFLINHLLKNLTLNRSAHCTQVSDQCPLGLLFEYFYGFLGFVVWEISGHFWGVYQSHYCASTVAFLFSFVYVIYLNIASYLYGKQIKSKLWTKLYLWMIFICVRLNWLHFHECRPMPLKVWHTFEKL